ncbi:hypothetical protein D9M68_429320 [compost metagenome]
MLWINSVYPLGSDRTTASEPTMPPVLARFSTTTDCPSDRPIAALRWRATTSVGPPGENGTTSVSGRVGKDCPKEGLHASNPMASAATHLMACLLAMYLYVTTAGSPAPPRSSVMVAHGYELLGNAGMERDGLIELALRDAML